jgi:hypothetical protein
MLHAASMFASRQSPVTVEIRIGVYARTCDECKWLSHTQKISGDTLCYGRLP